MVILAAFKSNFWLALAAATTLIMGAAYTLWLIKRVVFGSVENHHVAELKDVNRREFMIMLLLAVGVIGIGFYPAPIMDVMHTTIEHLVQQSVTSKLP
jgi:NADH-quinone oxidoreductase subunit M